jgi:hypothetical protein
VKQERIFVHLHDPESDGDIFVDIEFVVAVLGWGKATSTVLRIKDDVHILVKETPMEVMEAMRNAHKAGMT